MKIEERTKLKFPGIYLIKNNITGHCYVGQARHIARRIYEHLHSTFLSTKSDYNYPLHRAFRKYGIDNFELEVLEQCNVDELNIRERYWVAKFDSKNNGYNQTEGGYQSIRHIKLSKNAIEEIKQLLLENKLSNVEIGKKYNVSKDVIQRINTGRMWHDSSISYPIRQKTKERTYHFNGLCVKQYSVDGIELNVFPSISAAAQSLLGLTNKDSDSIAGAISRCCRKINKSAYGYKWQLAEISEKEWLKLFN